MAHHQKVNLTEDFQEINWQSTVPFAGICSIIAGFLTTLIVAVFFLYQHLSTRVPNLSRLPGRITLLFLLFVFLFFIASVLLSGIMEYRRHKLLSSAIITAAMTFFLGGGLALILTFVILGFMDNFFGQNYPLKTD